MARKEDLSRIIMSETHEQVINCVTASATHFYAEQLLSDQPKNEVKAFKRIIKRDHLKHRKVHTRNCFFRTKPVYSVNVFEYSNKIRPAKTIK